MLANNYNKTDYCIITITKSIAGEKRVWGFRRTIRNGYCFEWEMLQWSSANLFDTIFKHQDAWVMTDFLVDWTRNPCIFFFFWFPTNVNSPVQDDIPREVKFVNVLYYRKCCTDIPSHFLLCWLICNKIDDKIEVSWGGHISNIKLREKMEAKMLCSSGEEQKNMSLLVHYQIRLKIT